MNLPQEIALCFLQFMTLLNIYNYICNKYRYFIYLITHDENQLY